jgi:hypothetical protein
LQSEVQRRTGVLRLHRDIVVAGRGIIEPERAGIDSKTIEGAALIEDVQVILKPSADV